MFYNVKSGRLTFEAADVMTTYKAKSATKRNIIAVTETKTKRPDTKAKTYDSLEKKLSAYKIGFSRNSGKLFMKRLMGFKEILDYAKKASLYTAATMITAVLIYGSISAMDVRFAHEALIEGKEVGIIADVSKFEKLIEDMRQSLSITLGKEIEPTQKPVYIARLVFGSDLTSDYKLRQNILSTFNEVTEAYAIYANDTLLCGALNEEAANNALERVKAQYVEEGANMTVEFVDNISVRKEYIPIGYLRSEDGIFAALTSTKEGSKTYVVNDNDTLWEIANRFEMSVDELYSLNPNLSDTIHAGDEILITKSSPLLAVKTAYIYEGEKPIPYETKETQDADMPAGNRKVISEGTEGKKHVVEEIVKINGEVVEQNVKSEQIISQPVAAHVKVGTRKSLSSVASSGRLARPVYGTISSRFGRRSRGNHEGLDIAAPTGTPIKAADGGTISFAGWESGYGYLVKINHGDGYETYYGHCSKILVTVGQKVSKGDVIANVGNTGRSTGSHLHFEVRKNGVPQDPTHYIN